MCSYTTLEGIALMRDKITVFFCAPPPLEPSPSLGVAMSAFLKLSVLAFCLWSASGKQQKQQSSVISGNEEVDLIHQIFELELCCIKNESPPFGCCSVLP